MSPAAGRPPLSPKHETHRLNLRLPADLYARLRRRAADDDLSVSQVAREALDRGLG